MYGQRLLICAVLSAMAHLVFASGMSRLPKRAEPAPPRIVAVRIEPAPAPPPEPEKAAEPAPAPQARPAELPKHRARPVAAEPPNRQPQDQPPTERPATTGDTTGTPVFGISMESTSQAGGGPALPVGNTLRATPHGPDGPGQVKPLAAPVEPYEVTEMPLPKGRCTGRYTEEARQAAIEGTVVLDLIVDADGTTRDIKVVQGLGHGLTEAAVAALKACRFTPGERKGQRVPVRIRGFKIHFYLQESE